MTTTGLTPSIISANYRRFGEQLDAVEPYAVRWHVDVMDGHYVPNLTIGPDTFRAIAAGSKLPQDAHLMVSNPADTWSWYTDAGADRIIFHAETAPDPGALIAQINDAGHTAGFAINPPESASDYEKWLEKVSVLVVMSVRPGFSGQKFIPEALPKLEHLRKIIDRDQLDVELVIDGGVSPDNAARCVEAGAHLLVSASAIFKSDDPVAVAKQLAETAR